MDAVSHHRGLALLVAHCSSLDPSTVRARERLDAALGPELAGKLVSALSGSRALPARPVFAA
jgi:hypothetical protein